MTRQDVPIVTIDGPGGAGKGTIAQAIAARLDWHFLDSGAIYRLLALDSLEAGIAVDDLPALIARSQALQIEFPTVGPQAGEVLLNGVVVTTAIRDEACGARASELAAIPAVRDALLARQRAFRQWPGLVADGRDMGTVVFPDAAVKIFLTASAEERARRRHKQLMEQGVSANLADLLQELRARDQRDMNRAVAPLAPAEDAISVDTTSMDVEAVIRTVMEQVEACIPNGGAV
ncbi:cytidylate kinase [Spiribacter salinus M19-40]|uniref:Cytidylate kinase n=1 Tax=Spiribacter salinus M19-40 TaxID=1260251 RepID=R4V6Z8_9GAMM|nr:(d)CMP kinase [Spiribacter salinus]AGM40770.1 cytidylate kinase [Spiribacter salinus M19-40]MDR9413658.1 (d)CMP kinase [Spiribacter sp.]